MHRWDDRRPVPRAGWIGLRPTLLPWRCDSHHPPTPRWESGALKVLEQDRRERRLKRAGEALLRMRVDPIFLVEAPMALGGGKVVKRAAKRGGRHEGSCF